MICTCVLYACDIQGYEEIIHTRNYARHPDWIYLYRKYDYRYYHIQKVGLLSLYQPGNMESTDYNYSMYTEVAIIMIMIIWYIHWRCQCYDG